MSSGVAITPRDVRRDGEDEEREETTEPDLGQRGRQAQTPFDAHDRGHADGEGGPDVGVPVARLPPGAGGDGREDRREGGRLGVQLAPVQREERRHEEDAAAHAEESGDDARDEAEQGGEQERGHATSSRTPTTTRKAANPRASARERRRCCSAVPPTAPTAAGRPTSAA